MYKVEAKLARWKQLYVELNDARSRLRDTHEDPSSGTTQLRAEVRRLQRESQKALDEIHAAVAARNPPGGLDPNQASAPPQAAQSSLTTPGPR